MVSSVPLFDRKRLFHLAWPLVIEQLLFKLVGVVDIFMVAHIGEAAVSGVSLVDSVNYMFIQVLYALTAGGTVVCAQSIGARDRLGAGKCAAQLVFLSVTCMTVVFLVFVLGGRNLLALLFGAVDDDVMADASMYMYFTAASFPFMALFYSVAAAFRAQGKTRISMLATLFMNVLNVAGNAVCIFVLHMGVLGVALATLVACAVSAVLFFCVLQRPDNDVRVQTIGQLKPDAGILRQILSIGAPNAVENAVFYSGKVMLQSLVATLGTASIAAYAVASSLVNFFFIPGNALGTALLTIVGQCYGAGEHAQAKGYVKKLLVVNYVLLVPICAAMIGGVDVWMGFYNLSDSATEIACQLLIAHSIAMVLWPPAFLFAYYFRAIGRARFTMVVSIATMAVCRIGLSYLFVWGMQLDVLWVWIAMFVDWAARIVIFVVAFKRVQTE